MTPAQRQKHLLSTIQSYATLTDTILYPHPETGSRNILNAIRHVIIIIIKCNLYSALSLQISNALHALCQYIANRKHLSDRLK